jgi:hypothetical protein
MGWLLLLLVLLAAPVDAATRYVSLTGSDANSCATSETITTPKRTFASAVACLNAGDTLYIRGGTWTERIDLQSPTSKTGTVDAWITIAGYPGETVIIRYTDTATSSYGAIKARGNRGYFIFQDFAIDGINFANNTGWQIRDGNHHFILRRLEIYNQFYHGVLVTTSSANITIEDSKFHDMRSDCVSGNRHHGIYLHDGSDAIARRNEIYNAPGGGVQLYPGPWTNAQLLDNYIHHTNTCTGASTSGIVVATDTDPNGGSISGAVVTGNIIAYTNQHTNGTIGGQAAAVRFYNGHASRTVDVKFHNNVIYKAINNPSAGLNEYCMIFGDGAVTADVRNNVMTDCGGNGGTTNYISVNTGAGTITASNQACLASENCPGTDKVTIASAAAVMVDPVNGDFRLKNGANALRNAGTSVTTRPNPVGVTDIGAYEQPEIASASIDAATIEATFSTGGQALTPTTGLTGLTPGCSGHASCGTPIVSSVNLKAGSDVTVQILQTGIGGGGNCALTQTWVLSGASVNFGAGYVGPPGSAVQGVNDFTNFDVTEICTGSGGVGPGGEYAYYTFNASDATDQSGNGHHGTVTPGLTYLTAFEGIGAFIPTDATFRHIEVTGFGTGRNPSTDSLSKCVVVTPETAHAQKVVFSAGGNGTNQRWYLGWTTVGGQKQWGIGIQGSSFTTGSEFPVSAQPTLVCLRSNATNDTAYLSVDGVTGTIAGKSVKTYTSYTLAGDLRTGNDGTNTDFNGGFVVDEDRTWNTFISDADVLSLYNALFAETPPAATEACYLQKTHRWQRVYLDGSSAPEDIGSNGDTLSIVENGAVAVVFQLDCTGSAGSAITLKFFYSTDGTTFALRIPGTQGTDNIWMWDGEFPSYLNQGTATCCLTGALTQNNGFTITDAISQPTITLAQDHSYTVRLIIRVGAIAGQSRWIKAVLDNGTALPGGYTPSAGARLTVIPAQANGF